MAREIREDKYQYVRDAYGVPNKYGATVRFEGCEGKVVGARGAYIVVKFPEEKRTHLLHPTWHVDWLLDDGTWKEGRD